MNYPLVKAEFIPPAPKLRQDPVRLTLPYPVAQTLLTVVGGIAGNCQGRLNITAIYTALTELGVVSDAMSAFSGSIRENS